MSEEYDEREGPHLTKARLEALSDGIFAFAMTLLVISINLPDKATLVQSNAFALHTLISLYSSFYHYVLAFLILAAFWVSQHIQFHSVRTPDKIFIWINLITLMFVALLPFSTSFNGSFTNVPVAAMVFQANLFALGMGMSCQWWYATRHHRLAETSLNPSYIRRMTAHNLIVPAVSLFCILVALTGITWSSIFYLTLPPIEYIVQRIYG
jgi:uncharacterized membrane protein